VTPDDLREFFAELGRGDFDALGRRLHPDVILEFPGRRFGGRFEGRRRVLVFLRQNQRLFRDGLTFDVAWAGVTGDGRGVVQWKNGGLTRDGRPYANRGVTVLTFEGGLVRRIEDYLDTEALVETWPERRPAGGAAEG